MHSGDIESDTSDEYEPKRKKFCDPSSHKRNVIKNSKVSGTVHTNWVGKEIPARCTGINCKCQEECFKQFNEDDMQYCIATMNNFSTKDEQDIYLQQHIEKREVERRRPRIEDRKCQRRYSSQFYVSKVSNKIKVCKAAFISLYGISASRVRRLCDLKVDGKLPHDNRGHNLKTNIVPPTTCQKIHEHILSFPRKKSHYATKRTEYLDERLNVKIMHHFFTEENPDLHVKYRFYLNYFNTHFSLNFGRPQIDTCITCEELTVKIKQPHLSENAKQSFIAEQTTHKKRANRFYNKISSVTNLCKERDDVAAITFDFMQNLPLPNIPIQNIFYLRQLWVHCFGIKDLKTGKSTFYMYHEGIANKGSNEVCSMILDYINNNIGSEIKDLYLFCDGCPGQNKNNTLIRVLMALTDTNRFENIYQCFPVRGHSFLPNDRDFGVIKNILKKHDRVYTPNEYFELVKKSSSKFTVRELQTEEVLEFKNWWPRFYKKSCLSTESYGKKIPKDKKVTFSPSFYMSFHYDASKPGTVITEESIGSATKNTFVLKKKSNCVVTLPSTKAYGNSKVPINENKINDLKKVENSILVEHLPFYRDIFNWPTTTLEREE